MALHLMPGDSITIRGADIGTEIQEGEIMPVEIPVPVQEPVPERELEEIES